MEPGSSIMVIALLLILSGFFSASETALFSLTAIERKRVSERHPLIGRTVNGLLERPRRTLISILIGNMVVNTLAVVIATLFSIEQFGEAGVGLSIGIFTLILLMFGEILPKILAIRNNVLIAELNSPFLELFAKLVFPARFLVRKISDWILTFLVSGSRRTSDRLSEDELKALVRIGEEEGVLRKEEVRMISRLIDLGEREAKEIMTPKTDLVAFDMSEGPGALTDLIRRSHFSYVPVYEDSLDNLLGVISTQEFMLSSQEEIRPFIQVSDYVPETKRIGDLLLEFKMKEKKFAVCVDEYGSVSGLVTFEDVLEEVFGEFHDEYAQIESLIRLMKPGEYVVQAKIPLREFNDTLGVQLRSESSETLNGWLLEKIGRIPKYNESFVFERLHFHVAEVFRNRINKVYVRKPL